MSQAELAEQLDALARQYGNRFLLEPAPDHRRSEHGMRAVDAMRLIGEELVLDGIPMRNLATFVTTWMEPEAQRVIAENLHRNFIDHAEYPQTAEIEQRCIRILADLFHAPGETTGARTQGSSEAIMLGALSLKWKWRERREQAGKGTDRPNLVFGGDVHVVWEKFCRYFDVEPRIIPLQKDKYTIGPEDVEPHVDENTIGVAAVLGTTFTGHADDIVGINDLLLRLKSERGLDVPLHVDGASGGFVWPFLYPDSEWDFRLEQVRSINASGHKFGLVYPGIGWLVFRERSDLPEDLVFYENYLGKTDATFTLNFSTGSAMVLAQYYNFVRFGRAGYRYIMETMQENTRLLTERLADVGLFQLIGDESEEQLPLVAFQLAEEHDYDEFDIASQLAAERGWMVPAYTLPPNADHVKIMRALVKLTLGHSLVTTLADDIAEACETLEQKGGLHDSTANESRPERGTDMSGRTQRIGSIAVVLLLLVAGAAVGCGESDEEKAQNDVCDARDDLQQQVNDLSKLTLSTATVEGVQKNLNAIQDDLQKISDAQGNLSDERHQQVESANKQFNSQLNSIAEGLTSNLSLSGAEAKLRSAAKQLASSYKQTFAKVDCG